MNTIFFSNVRKIKLGEKNFTEKITLIKESFVTINNSDKVQFLFILSGLCTAPWGLKIQ